MADNTNNTNPTSNGAGAAPAANQPVNTPAANPTVTMNPEELAQAFAKALNTRTDRAERSVARSFAEQYGMTEAEVTALLEKAKADKVKAIPPEVQQQIDAAQQKANNLLIVAETKSISAELGFIDADVAFQLMDKANVKVDEAGKVTGVKEALEALKMAKPFLAAQQQTGGAWGQKQGGSAPLTKEQILAIKDPTKRQKAIAENLGLFGK